MFHMSIAVVEFANKYLIPVGAMTRKKYSQRQVCDKTVIN